MKTQLMTIMTLMTLVSCNQTGGTGGSSTSSSKSAESKNEVQIEDVTTDFEASFESECMSDSDMEFGWHKKYFINLDRNESTMRIVEYAMQDCQQEMAIRTYRIDGRVDKKTVESRIHYKLYLDILDSKVEIKHATYEGWDECGFPLYLNDEYTLAADCSINKTDKQEVFSLYPESDDQVRLERLLAGEESIILTKINN